MPIFDARQFLKCLLISLPEYIAENAMQDLNFALVIKLPFFITTEINQAS